MTGVLHTASTVEFIVIGVIQQRWWILSSVIKCERWIIQRDRHGTKKIYFYKEDIFSLSHACLMLNNWSFTFKFLFCITIYISSLKALAKVPQFWNKLRLSSQLNGLANVSLTSRASHHREETDEKKYFCFNMTGMSAFWFTSNF